MIYEEPKDTVVDVNLFIVGMTIDLVKKNLKEENEKKRKEREIQIKILNKVTRAIRKEFY